MLNRALNHPNRTTGMDDAINIFKNWLKKYNERNLKERIQHANQHGIQDGGSSFDLYNGIISNFGFPL
jgi:hypothetical protein